MESKKIFPIFVLLGLALSVLVSFQNCAQSDLSTLSQEFSSLNAPAEGVFFSNVDLSSSASPLCKNFMSTLGPIRYEEFYGTPTSYSVDMNFLKDSREIYGAAEGLFFPIDPTGQIAFAILDSKGGKCEFLLTKDSFDGDPQTVYCNQIGLRDPVKVLSRRTTASGQIPKETMNAAAGTAPVNSVRMEFYNPGTFLVVAKQEKSGETCRVSFKIKVSSPKKCPDVPSLNLTAGILDEVKTGLNYGDHSKQEAYRCIQTTMGSLVWVPKNILIYGGSDTTP